MRSNDDNADDDDDDAGEDSVIINREEVSRRRDDGIFEHIAKRGILARLTGLSPDLTLCTCATLEL